MPFHVRDTETDALVRELARKRKVGLTEAVKLAVRNELDREEQAIPLRTRIATLRRQVLKRPATGLEADKAFHDDLSGGAVMFVDASAMVAMLTEEIDGDALADCLASASERWTSAIAVFQTVAALARKRSYSIDEARAIVSRFLEISEIRLMPIGKAESEAALMAFERFGKGRHPASLNLGDCFAYGCAKALDAPLLFKGDDFPHTDIRDASLEGSADDEA